MLNISFSLAGTKQQIIARIQESDKNLLTVLYTQLAPDKQTQHCYDEQDAMEVYSTLSVNTLLGPCTLTLMNRDFKQFRDGAPLLASTV